MEDEYGNKIYQAIQSKYAGSGFTLSEDEFLAKMSTNLEYRDKIHGALVNGYADSGFTLSKEEFSGRFEPIIQQSPVAAGPPIESYEKRQQLMPDEQADPLNIPGFSDRQTGIQGAMQRAEDTSGKGVLKTALLGGAQMMLATPEMAASTEANMRTAGAMSTLKMLIGKADSEMYGDWSVKQIKEQANKELEESVVDGIKAFKLADSKLKMFKDDRLKGTLSEMETAEDYGNFIKSTLGQLPSQMVATIGTAGLSTIFLETGMIQMQMIEQQLQANPGWTVEDVLRSGNVDSKYAIGGGLVAGSMDLFSLGYMLKATGLSKVGSKMVAGEIRKMTGKRAAKQLAKVELLEYGQEATQGTIEDVSAELGTGQIESIWDHDMDWDKFFTEGTAGSIMALPTGGTGTAFTYGTHKFMPESMFKEEIPITIMEGLKKSFKRQKPDDFADAEQLQAKALQDIQALIGIQKGIDPEGVPTEGGTQVESDIQSADELGIDRVVDSSTATESVVSGLLKTIQDIDKQESQAVADSEALLALKSLKADQKKSDQLGAKEEKKEVSRISKESKTLVKDEAKATKLQAAEAKQDAVAKQKRTTALAKESAKNKAAEQLSATRQVKEFDKRKKAEAKIVDKAAADMVKNVKAKEAQKLKDEKAQQLSQAKEQKEQKPKVSKPTKKPIADTRKADLIKKNKAKLKDLNAKEALKKERTGEYVINLETGEVEFKPIKKRVSIKKSPVKPVPKKMSKADVVAIVEKFTPAWLLKVSKNPNHPYHKVAKEIKENQLQKDIGSRNIATIKKYAKDKKHPQNKEAVEYLAAKEEKAAIETKKKTEKEQKDFDTKFRRNQEENAAKAMAMILYEQNQKAPNKERIENLNKSINTYRTLILEKFSDKDSKGLGNFATKKGQMSNVEKRAQTIFEEEKTKRKNKLKEKKETPAQKKEVDRTERANVLERGVKLAKAILEHKRDTPKDKKGLKALEEGIRLVEKRYKELIGDTRDPNFRKAQGRLGDGSVWLRAKRLFEADEKAVIEEKEQDIPEKLELGKGKQNSYDNFRQRGLTHDQALTLANDNRQIPEDMKIGEINKIVAEIKKQNKEAEESANIEDQKKGLKEVFGEDAKFEEIDLEEDNFDENDLAFKDRYKWAPIPKKLITVPVTKKEIDKILGGRISIITSKMLDIINIARKANNKPQITFYATHYLGHSGMFSPGTGKVLFDVEQNKTKKGKGSPLIGTVLHEILHPFTMFLSRIATTETIGLDGYSQFQSDFSEKVESLLLEARDAWEKSLQTDMLQALQIPEAPIDAAITELYDDMDFTTEYINKKGEEMKGPYGLKNADEFLSEAGSNPFFIKFLNELDTAPSNQTKAKPGMFSRLIAAVMEFYNDLIKTNSEEFTMRETSVLRKLIKVVDHEEQVLMSMDVKKLYDLYGETFYAVQQAEDVSQQIFANKPKKRNKIKDAITKHFVDGKLKVNKTEFINILNKVNKKLDKKSQISGKEAEIIYNSIIEGIMGKDFSAMERKLMRALDTSKMTRKDKKGVRIGTKVNKEVKDLLDDIRERLTGKVVVDPVAYIEKLEHELTKGRTSMDQVMEDQARENFLQEFQDFKNKPLKRQKQLISIVEKTLKNGKDEFKAQQRRKRQKNANIVAEAINTIGDKPTNFVRFLGGSIYKKGTIVEHKGRLYQVRENMTEGVPAPTGTKGTPYFKYKGALLDEAKIRKQNKIGKWLGKELLNFPYLMEHLSSLQDFKSELLRSTLGQRHSRSMFKSELQENTRMHDTLDMIVKKKKEILEKYGLKSNWDAVAAWTKKGKKMVELNEDNHSEVLKLNSQSRSMTANQALHHLMASFSNRNDEAYKEHDIDKKRLQQQLTSMLPIGYLDWGAYLVQDFFPKYYNEANEHFVEEYNMSLPKLDKYYPTQREIDPAKEDNRLAITQFSNGLTIFADSLRSVQKSKSLPRTQDADEVLLRYVSEMEHWMAWRNTIRDMRTAFRDPSVRSMIKVYHGKELLQGIDMSMRHFSGGMAVNELRNTLWDTMRRSYSYTTLGMNPSLITKQAISFIQYSQDVPFGEYIKSFGYLVAHPVEWKSLAMEIWKSEGAKTRFRVGESFDMEAVITQEINSYGGRRSKISHITMAPSRIGDTIATMVGGAVSYRINKAKYGEKEALLRWHELTTLRQQSALASNMSKADRSSGGKLFHQFASNMMANMRNLHSNSRIIRQAFRYAKDNGKDASWALKQPKVKRAMRAIITTNIVFNAMFSAVSEGLSSWVDDEEFDWAMFGMGSLSGTLAGLPWIGRLVTWLAQGILTDTAYAMKPVPALSQVEELNFLIKSIPKIVDVEKELSAEDYRRAVKVANLALSYKFGAMPFYGLYDTFVYRGFQHDWDWMSMIFHTPVDKKSNKKKSKFR